MPNRLDKRKKFYEIAVSVAVSVKKRKKEKEKKTSRYNLRTKDRDEIHCYVYYFYPLLFSLLLLFLAQIWLRDRLFKLIPDNMLISLMKPAARERNFESTSSSYSFRFRVNRNLLILR